MDVREANENIQPVRDQFVLRFYRWALEESQREFSEGFPLVRQIKSLSAIRFLDFAERLDDREKNSFSSVSSTSTMSLAN